MGPPPSPTLTPTQGQNAIFPPTHHSLLGGQSLAKLRTKIKLRCRFLPIALNRADWIRIFPFSSHLDHLGDWGPEGRLGPGGGGKRGSERLPSTFQLWNLGVRVQVPPPPTPFPRGKFIPCLSTLLSGRGWARPRWVGSSPLFPSKLKVMYICHNSVWQSILQSPSSPPPHTLQLKVKM